MRDRVRPRSLVVPSRRQFLVGAAATSLVLAACGDEDTPIASPNGSSATTDTGGVAESDLSVVRFFGPYFVAGSAVRVPFGIADIDGLLPKESAPTEVEVVVTPPGGEPGTPMTVPVRGVGLPRPYYAFEFTPEEPGFYDFTVNAGVGGATLSQVQIVGPDAPGVDKLIGPGDQMTAVATPTVDDPRGVTPVCTREPPCDLHQISVADAVGTGPLVLLVATPAFCQTVVCGPELDVLLDRIGAFAGVTFVHAEVYADPENNETPPVLEDFAPVIDALGLPFEPVLYTVGADGAIVERLDYIFDGDEITGAIERLVG